MGNKKLIDGVCVPLYKFLTGEDYEPEDRQKAVMDAETIKYYNRMCVMREMKWTQEIYESNPRSFNTRVFAFMNTEAKARNRIQERSRHAE